MEIFQLIQFQAVAELEHMTQAAQRLNLAQPALSRTIQNLENELGASLTAAQSPSNFTSNYSC